MSPRVETRGRHAALVQPEVAYFRTGITRSPTNRSKRTDLTVRASHGFSLCLNTQVNTLFSLEVLLFIVSCLFRCIDISK